MHLSNDASAPASSCMPCDSGTNRTMQTYSCHLGVHVGQAMGHMPSADMPKWNAAPLVACGMRISGRWETGHCAVCNAHIHHHNKRYLRAGQSSCRWSTRAGTVATRSATYAGSIGYLRLFYHASAVVASWMMPGGGVGARGRNHMRL